MSAAIEREIDRLEAAYAESDDPNEKASLYAEIRELGRELADEERWRQEGSDRGFER